MAAATVLMSRDNVNAREGKTKALSTIVSPWAYSEQSLTHDLLPQLLDTSSLHASRLQLPDLS